MGGYRGSRWAVAAAVAVLAGWLITRGGGHPTPDTAHPQPSVAAAVPTAPTTSASPSGNNDPARFAPQVRTRAGAAGIDPQLMMAILYNESYKPHDPEFERNWQRLKPDAAFGVANMHRAAFDETRQGRDFAGRSWDELPDDPDLAIEAAAWYLHDLAARLPAHPRTTLDQDELLAVGYNTGADGMLAIAQGTTPGAAARAYLDELHGNWAKAGAALGR